MGPVLVGLGITVISRDAVARELEEGALEEWRCSLPRTASGSGGAESIVPRHRAWHVAARAGDELPPTARLFLSHLAGPDAARKGDRFQLVERR